MEKGVSNYGLALYSYAVDLNKVDAYFEEMKKWKDIFTSNEEFLYVLDSALKTKAERKEILKDTLVGIDENILIFFYVLIDNGVIRNVIKIIDSFISYVNEHKGIKEGIASSVEPLSRETLTTLEKKISKLEKREVYLKNVIDKSLIGGLKITLGDHIYDGSLANRLEKMKKDLLKEDA